MARCKCDQSYRIPSSSWYPQDRSDTSDITECCRQQYSIPSSSFSYLQQEYFSRVAHLGICLSSSWCSLRLLEKTNLKLLSLGWSRSHAWSLSLSFSSWFLAWERWFSHASQPSVSRLSSWWSWSNDRRLVLKQDSQSVLELSSLLLLAGGAPNDFEPCWDTHNWNYRWLYSFRQILWWSELNDNWGCSPDSDFCPEVVWSK